MPIKIKIKKSSNKEEGKEVLSTWTPANDDHYDNLEVLEDGKTKQPKPIKTSSEVRAAFSDVPMEFVPEKKPKSPVKPKPTTPTEPTTPATTPPKKPKVAKK